VNSGRVPDRPAPAGTSVGNAQIASVFEEIADLLEVQGENPFRIRAYRNAARTVGQQGPDFAARAARGETLGHLFGIGADLDGKIHEIARTGSCELLRDLRREVPRGTSSLLRVPGLGPKRVQTLVKHLGLCGPADLLQAAQAGRLRDLPGFGPKTEQRLLGALDTGRSKSRRYPLAEARAEADALLTFLRAAPEVRQAVAAGSLRRERPTVGDIDVLVSGTAGATIIRRFGTYPKVREVLASGRTRASVVLTSGIQVDLRVVPPSSFGAALLYFTGSKAYNIELRKRALARGLKLNEYGLFRGSRRVAGETEESIYAALELPWVPPTQREA
jgi:DNA polymerase (family 10)